jgi:hypothetical protein
LKAPHRNLFAEKAAAVEFVVMGQMLWCHSTMSSLRPVKTSWPGLGSTHTVVTVMFCSRQTSMNTLCMESGRKGPWLAWFMRCRCYHFQHDEQWPLASAKLFASCSHGCCLEEGAPDWSDLLLNGWTPKIDIKLISAVVRLSNCDKAPLFWEMPTFAPHLSWK